MKDAVSITMLVAFACGIAGPALGAEQRAIQWTQIPVQNITLFYPGQSTYEWLLSPAHEKGNIRVAAGRPCLNCHEGEEQAIGDKLVKGGPLEPTPIAGKNGTVKLALQAAHDAVAVAQADLADKQEMLDKLTNEPDQNDVISAQAAIMAAQATIDSGYIKAPFDGVVLAVKSNTRLKHIEFVRLDATQGMAILVGQDGTVENRIVALPPSSAAAKVNTLNTEPSS